MDALGTQILPGVAPAPALRYAFTIVAKVDPYTPLIGRPTEQIELIPITGGEVSGELAGEVMPVFRTAAPELQWLTRSAFIGRAAVFDGNTSIDVYEINA